MECWHSVENVVSLTVNVRAPGVLSTFLQEMRNGAISNAMWELYMSRVMEPRDKRLLEPPFATNPARYLVHRHSIRSRQAFDNAVAHCKAHAKPLYVVHALDEAEGGKSDLFTDAMRSELLALHNPRDTRSLPGILPLYEGMTVSLFSKDCVRFGLMKPCECTLEKIVFAPAEDIPENTVAGEPILLEYMPVSLILRAKDALWSLTSNCLPSLSPAVSRQGLFQLRPSTAHFRRHVEKDTYIKIRRLQFAVLPAGTKVIHSAQGESYDAVIVDMLRPPHMTADIHWLACYVMISRATSIDGLLILRPALRAQLDRKPPQFLLDEIDRLLALERACTQKMLRYLKTLTGKVPPDILELFASGAEVKEREEVNRARDRKRNGTSSPVSTTPCKPSKRPLGSVPGSEAVVPPSKIRRSAEKPRRGDPEPSSGDVPMGAIASEELPEATEDLSLVKKPRLAEPSPPEETLAGYAWLCFVCVQVLQLGAALRRIENDDEQHCALCGSCPRGIYDVPARLLPNAGLNLVLHEQEGPEAASASQADSSFCRCTTDYHACDLAERGCTSCRRTCHETCASPLCSYSPCAFCSKFGVYHHEDSSFCLDLQRDIEGCHECLRLGCHRTSPKCHGKCVPGKHVCDISYERGCGSCHQTCHRSCVSPKCSYTPCVFCLSFGEDAHEDSPRCLEMQTDEKGCHLCGRLGCSRTSPTCQKGRFQKCQARNHLCGPSLSTAESLLRVCCSSCGQVCHLNNEDERCAYFNAKARAARSFEEDNNKAKQLGNNNNYDIDKAKQDLLAIRVAFKEKTEKQPQIVEVNGESFYEGAGSPVGNNCLIDSLRQCLKLEVDPRKVRDDLFGQFGKCHPKSGKQVTPISFLGVHEHWEAIVQSLFLHNTSGRPSHCNVKEYCVLALYAQNRDQKCLSGNRTAKNLLVLMNQNGRHFNPCLRSQSSAASSGCAPP